MEPDACVTFLDKCINKIRNEAKIKNQEFGEIFGHNKRGTRYFTIYDEPISDYYGVNSEKRTKYTDLIFAGYPNDIYEKFLLRPSQSFLLVADGLNNKYLTLPFDLVKRASRRVAKGSRWAVTIRIEKNDYYLKGISLEKFVTYYP